MRDPWIVDDGVTVRLPELHTYKSSGPEGASDLWRVWCATCGWGLSGTGETDERDVAATSHRCGPEPS